MQSTGAEPNGPNDALLAALFQVGRTMRDAGGRHADPHTYWLLHQLRCRGTTRMTDLAEALRLDTSTVSRQLQQLDRSGLVHRTRHPDDGRAQAVGISAAGEDLLDRAHHERLKFLAERTADWDPADLATLTRLLTLFAGSVPSGEPHEQIAELEHA